MGIKGFAQVLESAFGKAYKEKISMQERALRDLVRGRVLAVDVSIWIYQFSAVCMSEDGVINGAEVASGVSQRALALTESLGATLVFVFDGATPECKREECARRRARADALIAQGKHAQAVRPGAKVMAGVRAELLAQGFGVLDAPFEAEAECARLTITGEAWGVVSEDSDVMASGGARLIRKLNPDSLATGGAQLIEHAALLSALGMSHEQLMDVCVLCGSDYTGTIPGVGPKTALKLVKQHGSVEGVIEHLRSDGAWKRRRANTRKRKREAEAKAPAEAEEAAAGAAQAPSEEGFVDLDLDQDQAHAQAQTQDQDPFDRECDFETARRAFMEPRMQASSRPRLETLVQKIANATEPEFSFRVARK